MQAIVKQDITYCEIFADFEGKGPDDIILPSGTVVELLNNHNPACILVEVDGGLCYGDIALESVTIIKESAMKQSERERQEARARLLEIIKPGDVVYTKIRHVSRSGMYRVINLYIVQDGEIRNIDYHAANLLEGYDNRHNGCKASGCGMDMGFALVYNLSSALFRDGFDCIGKGCPSNDHVNREDNTRHRESGYALRQRWM